MVCIGRCDGGNGTVAASARASEDSVTEKIRGSTSFFEKEAERVKSNRIWFTSLIQ